MDKYHFAKLFKKKMGLSPIHYVLMKRHIPLVHFQMNVVLPLRGRGVLPDYSVINNQMAIAKGENAFFQFAIELIQENK